MEKFHRDALVVAVLACGCGVIAGASAFGPWKSFATFLSQEAVFGWAAAIGTWAVGIAAFLIADSSHKLRLSEIDASKVRDYIAIRATLINIQMASGVYDRMVATGNGKRFDLESRHTILRSIISLLPPTTISSLAIFKESDRLLSHPLDVVITMLRVNAEQFMAIYPLGKAGVAGTSDLHFQSVIGQMRAMHDMSVKLSASLDAQAVRLRIPDI